VLRVPLDPRFWTLRRLALAAGLLLIAAVACVFRAPGRAPSTPPPPSPAPGPVPPAGGGGYLVCAWNVENLFDDEDDPADHVADEDWFARDPAALAEKVDLLARALLLQNGGRGPDVLVLTEVESRRAAALLRDALNDRLSPADRYGSLVFRENRVGRMVAPAVLARLPVRDDRTRWFPSYRLLEAHLVGPGSAPLVVLACHWTSRLRGGGEKGRAAYAATVYQAVSELTAEDPGADVLIAGDFNAGPDDPAVIEGLQAVSEPGPVVEAARRGEPLRLLDLTARLDPARDGTYFYRGTWEVYDHLVASPGLLAPRARVRAGGCSPRRSGPSTPARSEPAATAAHDASAALTPVALAAPPTISR
jgi:hypothetical protein